MDPELLVAPYVRRNAIKAVSTGDGTTTVVGLACVFDTDEGLERDFEGDYFHAKTFLSPRLSRGVVDEFEATFHHGIATRDEFKGLAEHDFTHPVRTKVVGKGLLAKLILDERDEYEREVAEAAKAGALGWSIGSASHRARKVEVAKGRNRIDRFPPAEIAITHRPMEPRTFAVPLKALLAPSVSEDAVLKALRELRLDLQMERDTILAIREMRAGFATA